MLKWRALTSILLSSAESFTWRRPSLAVPMGSEFNFLIKVFSHGLAGSGVPPGCWFLPGVWSNVHKNLPCAPDLYASPFWSCQEQGKKSFISSPYIPSPLQKVLFLYYIYLFLLPLFFFSSACFLCLYHPQYWFSTIISCALLSFNLLYILYIYFY